MKKNFFKILITAIFVSVFAGHVFAQNWTEKARGSWVRNGDAQTGDVVLNDQNAVCEIVVGEKEESNVVQAAVFLAADIEKISGVKPAIVKSASGKATAINLITLGNAEIPKEITPPKLQNLWEAHQILTINNSVWLVGSNPRGTAFAAYTLSERLGIDPLYLWTGYTPEKHAKLIIKKTDYYAPPPVVKYRGMFHDDEDILPRPFEYSGYPLRIGDVPNEWYEKFFETALRLRMNMVAPYTRVHRRYEVQKKASDWGLYYTSHHYDILLSNPFGIIRFGLGKKRNAGTDWDWVNKPQEMINYWRGGVEENREINAIYPVGLRGTDDHAYKFPEGVSEDEKYKIFQEVIATQVKMTKEVLPPDKQPLFHFTLYTEMLEKYQKGQLKLPPDVMIIWSDNNNGVMRALPQKNDNWKHGVYYHLSFLGNDGTKQTTHIVAPPTIAAEFKKIIDARATAYMLVNVSELREFVMEARMISDICWNGKTLLNDANSLDSSSRFVNWWSREYFGEKSAAEVAESYGDYYRTLNTSDKLWFGADRFEKLLQELGKKINGQKFEPVSGETIRQLKERDEAYRQTFENIEKAKLSMNSEQKQYFSEHVALGLLMDWRPTQAALTLSEALNAPNNETSWKLIEEARRPLEQLEIEIMRAERPPFEGWYRKTWIRRETKQWNPHRSYEQIRIFLSSKGTKQLTEPDVPRPDLTRFTRLWVEP